MTLHDVDVSLWAEVQSTLLKNKLYDQLDVTHLLEELDIVSKSDQQALYSYLVVLLTHMLKLRYQPEKACNSWRASCSNSRGGIKRILKRHPSYKRIVKEEIDQAYEVARENAHYETEVEIEKFPISCPFTVEQLEIAI